MEVLFCYILRCSWRNAKQRPCGRWKDNIKMLLIGMRWEGVDGINLAQGRDESEGGGAVMNTVTNLSVPYNLEFLD
jgi:hypothetical protein